jgi:histidinol-phosphate aminotransferase
MSQRTTVIVDEAYLEFEPDFTARTVVSLTGTGENVIVFRTFGKSMAWAACQWVMRLPPKRLPAQ